VVRDEEFPELLCPANQTVNNAFGLCNANVTYTAPVWGDNCGGAVINRTGTASGGVFAVGSSVVQFNVVDGSQNSVDCVMSVTVVDNELPVVNCPSNIDVGTDAGVCQAVVTYTTPVGTDNCVGAVTTLQQGLGSGQVFPIGTTLTGFNVSDAVGQRADCSFEVRVVDREAPIITCPSSVVLPAEAGLCSSVITYGVATATDNCGVVGINVTSGPANLSRVNVGNYTVQFTAWDAAGNSTSCQISVSVVDTEAPTLTCPGNLSQFTPSNVCGATVVFNAPNASDNCATVTVQQTSGINGSFFDVGVSSLAFIAVDQYGNSLGCQFTVTVTDNVVPIITCPSNITTPRTDLPQCSGQVNFTIPLGTDNCNSTTVRTRGQNSGTSFDVGLTAEEYTVTDASGNVAQCAFTIEVVDRTVPGIVCPTVSSSYSSEVGICGAHVSYSAPTTSDNCNVSTSGSILASGSGALFDVGNTTEVYFVRDVFQNNVSCSFTIRVVDVESPQIVCPASFSRNNDAGQCSAVVTYVAPVGTDNCQPQTSLASGLGSGGNFTVGAHNETYTVVDQVSFSNSCTFTITVVDNEAPRIECPSNVSVLSTNGLCVANTTYGAVTAWDNCGSATISLVTSSFINGSAFPVGVTNVVFMATDGVGLTSTCTFSVTVIDQELPVLGCPGSLSFSTDVNVCGANVAYNVTHSDNCAWSNATLMQGQLSNTIFPTGVTEVVYRARDLFGNLASCQFNVTVSDTQIPLITCPSNISQNADSGLCSSFVTYSPPSVSDNCALSSATLVEGLGSGSNFPLGVTRVSYSISDPSGLTASCSFFVTVLDRQLPQLSCANQVIETYPGVCSSNLSYLPTYSDNCGISSFSQYSGLPINSSFPLGTSRVSFVVRDTSDNIRNCTFTIRVVDIEVPAITCSSNIVRATDPAVCSATFTYPRANTSDNCVSTSVYRNLQTNTFALGTTQDEWVVLDGSFQINSCQLAVTIFDNEPPVLACPSNVTVNTDLNLCSAVVSYNAPVVTDNCQLESTVLQTANASSGSQFAIGVTPVMYWANDSSSNAANCSFYVTVVDRESPRMTCANVSAQTSFGVCSANVAFAPVTAIDNCGSVMPILISNSTFSNNSAFSLGRTIVSYFSSDGFGNNQTCAFTVTVSDNQAPVLTCPSNISVNTDFRVCGAAVNFSLPSVSDNCGTISPYLSSGFGPLSNFSTGSTLVSYNATDESGNVGECSFAVTVTDAEYPRISCPASIITSTLPGLCLSNVSYSTPLAVDNCAISGTAITDTLYSSGQNFSAGSHFVNWSTTDSSSLTTSCLFSVTVLDLETPAVTCPADQVLVLSQSECSARAIFGTFSATDNCGVVHQGSLAVGYMGITVCFLSEIEVLHTGPMIQAETMQLVLLLSVLLTKKFPELVVPPTFPQGLMQDSVMRVLHSPMPTFLTTVGDHHLLGHLGLSPVRMLPLAPPIHPSLSSILQGTLPVVRSLLRFKILRCLA